MRINKIVLIFAFCQISFCTFPQNLKKITRQADQLFDDKNYKLALAYYKDALSLNSEDAYLNFRYGYCLIHSPFNRKALPYLQKAYNKNSKVDEQITYLLGQAHQLNLEFGEAIISYELFHKYHATPEDNSIIKKRIKECEFGAVLLAHPVTAKIENLGKEVNSKASDYVPVIKADESEMVFTSTREGTTGDVKDQNGEFFKDIYISKNVNGKWSAPKNMGGPINTDQHDASIGLAPDGTQLFLYRDDNGGDIYISKLNGIVWDKPKPFKEINTKYSELHCSITPDGKTLYFNSDRPGGYGGFDIYKISKDNKGKWSAPVNLGTNINTEEDEDSPFIFPDGTTLYFSSEGHSTMGGYDIFKSQLENGQFRESENLGYPINSPDDDIYFVLSADGKTGYFSSAKEDTYGEKDIYKISMPKQVNATAVATHKVEIKDNLVKKDFNLSIAHTSTVNPITILKGTIRDALTKQPLEGKITITDNTKNEVIGEITSNNTTGAYLIILTSGTNYGITVNKEPYLFHSENFDIPLSTNYQEFVVDVDLKRVSVGTKIILKNIFFDFDKATLRSESFPELQQLFQVMKQSNIIVQISGHTDNMGTAEYNKSLSEKRSKAVVDYLVIRGITNDRFKFAGFGSEKPIAQNKKADGSDYPEGRQLNRRTEFEIIGTK